MGTNVRIIVELSTNYPIRHAQRLAICRWLGLFFEHLFEYPQP
ncbi:MAG: hypothetical protein RIR15_546 [Actinomycetota bacterium]|jgi:hypothetical protein